MASYFPELISSSEVPLHDTRGIRPPAMSHCSNPDGKVFVHE
jgi:hypothetical protein